MSGSEETGDYTNPKFGSLTGKNNNKPDSDRIKDLEEKVKVLTECVDALLAQKIQE